MAFVAAPKCVYLDEADTGVDPTVRHNICRMIKDLVWQKGRMCVFATHWMHQAENLCSSIMLVDEGNAVVIGSLAQLKAMYCKGYTVCVDFKDDKFAESLAIKFEWKLKQSKNGQCI